ncbi:hypothetical protein HY494_00555 [Candidatus Woesearchaeota archaeon]|nr:hypothetical protein [Candidatus Woesearchaeota archaeon]
MSKKWKQHFKKGWNFFWHDDSLTSWVVNIVIAFLVIRFILYPLLGMLLGTSFPIVAVISESMEHGLQDGKLCGSYYPEFKESFDNYWEACGGWYEARGITKEQFNDFPFPNGFDKGDVIVLWRANRNNIEVGDILIFAGDRPQPIIHRTINLEEEEKEGKKYYFYQTKGDHNSDMISGEQNIDEGRIYGKGLFRVPYLGWVKILFVDLVRPLGWNIQR